ncbi:uncharacterized protein DS421_2g43880 [Arachis hypogaea]|nr:uncharacterized protein DS421_2g43880 [Arachis hypogaea]
MPLSDGSSGVVLHSHRWWSRVTVTPWPPFLPPLMKLIGVARRLPPLYLVLLTAALPRLWLPKIVAGTSVFLETNDEAYEEFYCILLIRCYYFSYYLFIPRNQHYNL